MRLDVSHDLGNQAGDEVYAGLDGFFDEQVTVDTNDYRFFDGRVGLRKQLSFADLDVQFGVSHFRLDREAYVNTVGVQLSLERPFMDGRLALRGRHRKAYESFDVADDFTAQRTPVGAWGPTSTPVACSRPLTASAPGHLGSPGSSPALATGRRGGNSIRQGR